jgi:hypothetical protein
MTRTRDPQWSFADLEFLSQNVRLEPVLQAISNFIDQSRRRVLEGQPVANAWNERLGPLSPCARLLLPKPKRARKRAFHGDWTFSWV